MVITEKTEMIEPKYEKSPDMLERSTGKLETSFLEQLVAVFGQELKAQSVVNGKGEKLGNIEDSMIDLQAGRIAYAALSFGGYFEMSSKLFAIPWELLCIDNMWNCKDFYKQSIVANIAREKLEKAPGFDHNNWPREPDRKWLGEVYEYYGCKLYWAPAEEANRPQPPAPQQAIRLQRLQQMV
jgi:hypothetical protein